MTGIDRYPDGTIRGSAIGGLLRNPEANFATGFGLRYAKYNPSLVNAKKLLKKAGQIQDKVLRVKKKARKKREKLLHGPGIEKMAAGKIAKSAQNDRRMAILKQVDVLRDAKQLEKESHWLSREEDEDKK